MTGSAVNVRYVVDDYETAIAFYTELLGFSLVPSPALINTVVTHGNLRLRLSGVEHQRAKPTLDGRLPEPGGWNRIYVEVDDIEPLVEKLKAAGVTFRTDVASGPTGPAVLIEDPSGNPIELIQPTAS
jgi:catechol 2,3-dioxygenase-like lactoylglutathione lyase family enzyme